MADTQAPRPWTMWGKWESGVGRSWNDITDPDDAKRIARENGLWAFLLVPQGEFGNSGPGGRHMAYRYDEENDRYTPWETRRFCFYTLIKPPRGFTRDTA